MKARLKTDVDPYRQANIGGRMQGLSQTTDRGMSAMIVFGALSVLTLADLQAQVAKILPLGDSITRGTNDINYPNGSIPGGYRRELGNRLTAAGLSFDFVGSRNDNAAAGMDPDHQGINGYRTDEVLANLPSALSYAPDTILLMVGTNDILQNVSVSTAANNLSSLIYQITTNSPQRRLYVSTILPITQNWNGRPASELNNNANAYNNQVRSLVQQASNQGRKVTLVDMNASITLYNSNPGYNFFQPGDGIHPGQAGYNQMGDIWFNSVSAGGNLIDPAPGGGTTGYQAVSNGSFEAGFSGWSVSGNAGIANSAPYAATHGTNLVAFNSGNSAANGVVSQTFATRAGGTYNLDFDVGALAYNSSSQTLQVVVSGASNLIAQTITVYGRGGGSNSWQNQRYTFVADGGTTTITFRDLSTSTNSLDLILDDVNVQGPTP